jgi:predicted amidophosphoribosyltransferase
MDSITSKLDNININRFICSLCRKKFIKINNTNFCSYCSKLITPHFEDCNCLYCRSNYLISKST